MNRKAYGIPRTGLPQVREKILRNKPICVAFLGGSITEGYGASDPERTSWRALTGTYFKERYPDISFTFVHAGVGGTNSSFGAHRLGKHVLQQGTIDLLFVEFSANDGEDREESIRGMEGIVRQCRRLSPWMDICFLYTAVDKNLSEYMPFNIAVHEEVAAHYGIPSVNFAAKVYDRIQSGETSWEQLAPDRVHPNDAGYALYASVLQEFLSAALVNSDTFSKEPTGSVIPSPLIIGNYEYASMAQISQANEWEGFIPIAVKPDPMINWRYEADHLYSNNPDAWLTFTVKGQGTGLLLFCGPDTGIFEYSVDGSPFLRVNLFDDWCLGAFRPIIALFPIEKKRGTRRVTIRNTDAKDPRSTGTNLRILKLLTN
jgi:acyl-CoA thioesterase-1